MSGMPRRRPQRVDVPPGVRKRLGDLVVSRGFVRVRDALHVTDAVMHDALAPGGTMRPETLARLVAALDGVAEDLSAAKKIAAP